MRAEPYTILPDGNGRKKKRIEYARKKIIARLQHRQFMNREG